MSLTLGMIKNKLPYWVGEITYNNQYTLDVYKSSGLLIGILYQDKTRCIYAGYTYDNGLHELENAVFLTHFKRKHLLTIKINSWIQNIYVLQEIIE